MSIEAYIRDKLHEHIGLMEMAVSQRAWEIEVHRGNLEQAEEGHAEALGEIETAKRMLDKLSAKEGK